MVYMLEEKRGERTREEVREERGGDGACTCGREGEGEKRESERQREGERNRVHGWVSGCHGDHRRLKLCFY